MNYSFNTQRLSMRLIQQGDFDIFVQLYMPCIKLRNLAETKFVHQLKLMLINLGINKATLVI
nr:hypothetical protein BCU57_06295 [Shewanella sp. 10N.286.48.B5]